MEDSDFLGSYFSLSTENSILYETGGQITVEWKIKNFANQPKEIGDFLESPSFLLARAHWCLRVYPNGARNKDYGWVGLALHKKYPESKSFVYITIGIKKADGSHWKSVSSELDFKQSIFWGFFKSFNRSALLESNDLMTTDGALMVFCTIQIKGDQVSEANSQTSSSDSVETLCQNFTDLFLSGVKGDVSFKVNNQTLVAHQLVLSARSTVFQAMFETDMVEKNCGIVEIVDSDAAHFKDFLLFLYSGKADMVSSVNALGLYLLADKYNMKDLKVACSECLAREISVDSICDVAHLTSLHDEPMLLQAATLFFIKNAVSILETTKWFSFLTEHPTLANQLFLKMAKNYIK